MRKLLSTRFVIRPRAGHLPRLHSMNSILLWVNAHHSTSQQRLASYRNSRLANATLNIEPDEI